MHPRSCRFWCWPGRERSGCLLRYRPSGATPPAPNNDATRRCRSMLLGRLAALLAPHRSSRTCSSLAPCHTAQAPRPTAGWPTPLLARNVDSVVKRGWGWCEWRFSCKCCVMTVGPLLASHTPLGFPIVEKLGLVSRRAIGAVIGATLFTDFLSLFALEICLSLHREGLSYQSPGLADPPDRRLLRHRSQRVQ